MNQIVNNKYFKWVVLLIELCLYVLLFVHKRVINFDKYSDILMVILVIANWYYLFYKSFKKVKLKRNELIFLLLINLAISFFVSGKVLFFTDSILSITLGSTLYYILVNLFVFPFVYNFIYLLDNINIMNNKKENKDSKKFALKVFFFTFICWFIVCLIYYPGNITSDTVDVISQARGDFAINNSHPALYTILIRMLLHLWNNVFIIVLANVLFFSLVLAHIYRYLYEQNVKEKVLYVSIIIFVLLINNISLISMAWKDVPFTIAMLWLTFEVYKISKQKDEYFKKIINIIFLCISLLLTFFIRHNGMFPYYIVILYLLFLIIKSHAKVRIISTVIISILSILFVEGPVFNYYGVQKSNIMTVGSASFAAKGLASLVYYDAEFDEKDKPIIYSILSEENYKEYYRPYSMDEYSFSDIGWNEGLEKVGVAKIYELYIKYFFKYPNIIIRDRFDSNNLVWSYQTPKDGFNIKYSIGVQYPSWVDDFKGLERNDGGNYIPEATVFRKAVSAYQRISENIVLFDVVIWRFGFTLSLLLLAFYYTIIRKIKVIPVYLPTLISVLFWIALMSHQDYRYLWFMFVNTFFLIIFTLMEKKKIK